MLDENKSADNSKNNLNNLSKEEALERYEILLADEGENIARGFQSYEKMTFNQLYEGYKGILMKTSILVPLLFEKGKDEGKSVKEIREKIDGLGISYKVMMDWAPDWSKRKQIHGLRTGSHKRVNDSLTQTSQAQLADVKPVTIPPPEQHIIEPDNVVEHIPEPQPIPPVIVKPPPKHQKIKIIIPFGYVVRLSQEAFRLRTKAIYSIEYDTDIEEITDIFIEKK